MATTPTQNSVPSESPRDLKFNAGKIDEFVTSLALQYIDRFGIAHYTIEGMKQLVLEQIYSLGWNLKGSFQAGGTVQNPGDLLQDTSTGIWYRWDDLSSLPKNVPAGSTPSSAGGTGPGKWQPVDVADVLRKDLAKPSGAGLSGYDATVSYPANTVGAELNNRRKNMVFATADAGIPNNGTEVSSQVSAFINSNKGKVIVFDSGYYMFAGVVLNGSGWEGTTIIFKGTHLMSPNTDGSNNLAGSWSGLILGSNVNDVTLYYRGDGNKANQYNREHIFNVIVHGAQNIKIPFADIKEIRGDGIYITRDVVSYVNAKNLYIGYVNIYNSTKDGRNGVSITSCDGGHIDYFRSENVGGVVGGVQQPGGLDLEPNADAGNTFLIRDFTVDSAVAINAGSVGVGLVGQSDMMRIRNCHIKQAYVKNMGSIRMTGCQDSSLTGMVDTVGTGAASIMHSADRCNFNVNVTGAGFAAQIGILGNVKDSNITVRGSAINNSGVIVTAAERCAFDIDIPNFDKSAGANNYIGLWFRNPNNNVSPVVRDCTFKLVCPASSGANQAVNWLSTDTTPVTFANSNKLLSDSNFVGYANFTSVIGSAGDKITKEPGIPGLTSVSSIPANGAFRAGDIVYSSSPGTLTFGWIRLTTGASHILGTDWGRLTYSNT